MKINKLSSALGSIFNGNKISTSRGHCTCNLSDGRTLTGIECGNNSCEDCCKKWEERNLQKKRY